MTITATELVGSLLAGGSHDEALAELRLAITLLDEDRHTRAMAQARAAGIDALRELRTSAA